MIHSAFDTSRLLIFFILCNDLRTLPNLFAIFIRSCKKRVNFAMDQHVNEHRLSSSKLCRQICVIRDKRPKVGMRLSLTAYIHKRFIDVYIRCPVCVWRHRWDIVHLYVRTYVCTYIHSAIPEFQFTLMRDRRTCAPLRNEVRCDLPLSVYVTYHHPLLKLSIIPPGQDLISRDNVAARTNVYTCAR